MSEQKTRFATGFIVGAFITFAALSFYASETYGRMSDHKHCSESVSNDINYD